MDLALNKLQMLICHKTQTTNLLIGYINMEINNGNESDSMKKTEKQSNPKVMNLL